MWRTSLLFAGAAALFCPQAQAQTVAAPLYHGDLAKAMGGDDHGMRSYVLVVLKTGPNKVPEGPARTSMFEGHMANIGRLASEKKMVVAGPLDGVDGWRGVFVLATPDIDVARTWIATDPVIVSGEMVAEYHKWFASAGLMGVTDIHKQIQKK